MNRNESSNTMTQRVYRPRTSSTTSASVVSSALVPLPRQQSTAPPEASSSNSNLLASSERRSEAEPATTEKSADEAAHAPSAEKAKQRNKKSAAQQKADCKWKECTCEPDNAFYVDGSRSYFQHAKLIDGGGKVLKELQSGDQLRIYGDLVVHILIGMYRPNGGEVSLHVLQKNSPDRESVCSHGDLTSIDNGTADTLAAVNAWKERRDAARASKKAENPPKKKRTVAKTDTSKAQLDKRIKTSPVQNLDQIRTIVKEEVAAMAAQLQQSQEIALKNAVEKLTAWQDKIEVARTAERTQYIDLVSKFAPTKSS
jgi:hypothetical protein